MDQKRVFVNFVSDPKHLSFYANVLLPQICLGSLTKFTNTLFWSIIYLLIVSKFHEHQSQFCELVWTEKNFKYSANLSQPVAGIIKAITKTLVRRCPTHSGMCRLPPRLWPHTILRSTHPTGGRARLHVNQAAAGEMTWRDVTQWKEVKRRSRACARHASLKYRMSTYFTWATQPHRT